jgi:glucosamine-6-phosphate deaminase
MAAIAGQPRRGRIQHMRVSELPMIARLSVDSLEVFVFENRGLAGRAAAAGAAQAIAERQRTAGQANVVFAAAPSQNEFLAGLLASEEIDWARVVAFHMDEYLGVDADHPASLRRYLQEHLFRLAGLTSEQLRLIPGEQVERPLATCLAYEDLLRAEPPDIVCAGIGENGHLAFNDPPVADFLDPVLVKVVRLDAACRNQQQYDGDFARVEDVPTHGYTLTIPALLSAAAISVVVPGPRKANAVLATLRGPISEGCPASILRRHPGAKLYLDRDSARLVL